MIYEEDFATVFYDPFKPKRIYVAEKKKVTRIFGIGFTIAGILFLLMGYGAYTGFIPYL